MQELRSTDIIDKEIHSDAVKKAEKIVKKADADCEALLNSLEDAIEKDQADKKALYSKKLAIFERDQKASIPIEEERFEVTFVQNKIVRGINTYLEGKKESERLEIVSNKFDFKSCENVNAYVYGFDKAAAQKFLEKKLGKKLLSCQETSFGKIVLEDDCGLEKPEGIILESDNKEIRIRLTMSEVISHLLDKNRAELSQALFGGQI